MISHLNKKNKPKIVDVSIKKISRRIAIAEGIVKFSNELPWSKKPKKIFTAVHNFYDDVFKIWAFEKKKNQMSRNQSTSTWTLV